MLTSNGTVGSWQDPPAPAAGTTWLKIGEVDAVAASVDFTGMNSAISDLQLLFDLLPGTNGAIPQMQTYGADGVLDIGSLDYAVMGTYAASNGSLAPIAAKQAFIPLILNSPFGVSNDAAAGGIFGTATFANIQAPRFTRCVFHTNYGPDSRSAYYWYIAAAGTRLEADRITGIRLIMSAGRFREGRAPRPHRHMTSIVRRRTERR